MQSHYNAETRVLTVTLAGQERFRYVFNKGGAINGIYDLQIAPETNLIAESYQGETTDRVIQWTYWNSRYETDPHTVATGDVRANVTMEGSFHEAATCDVIATPASGVASTLVFRSRIRHWFYANLDSYGQPDFETTSRYDVLPDGSLKLTRAVLRRPWLLTNVLVVAQVDGVTTKTRSVATKLEAEHLKHKSLTSYFEGWTPLRRTVLPKQKHANGEFKDDGYKFWRPQDLGGWAMAYGEHSAFAVVFGKTEFGARRYKTRVVFNKLDWPADRVNVLMPAVETDWPENSTLTQTLVFVVGKPADVEKRANRIVDSIPVPVISEQSVVQAVPGPGAVVFQTNFDTPAERQGWSRADFSTWEPGTNRTTVLRVTVPGDQATGAHLIRLPLDLTRYRGCRLLFECLAQATDVSQPATADLGVKFMLHFQSATAGPQWQNENGVAGTFDWRKLRFSTLIEPDAAHGEIALGLQGSSGTARFAAVQITVIKGPVVRPPPPQNPPPVFRGHDLPRLRGVMSPFVYRDDDLRVLGTEWKANVIRWQLTRSWGQVGTDRDLADYDRWLEGKLAELDKVLAACRRYGIKVVVDLHSPPGGRYANNDMAIFHEAQYQDHWVTWWEKIARRFKGNQAIWGYDLINEPAQTLPPPVGVADYLGGQVRAAKAIRAIDPTVPLFIAAADASSAAGFRELEPVDVTNVIYELHMYTPMEFTHQGVGSPWTPTKYPGLIAGRQWDQAQLRRTLQPVREFQRAYNVHIYVGEFSAVRWAPGAAQHLRDCIELFEEYGWDWTYHAYREWDGWSVEHGSDRQNPQPSTEPTDRLQLLLSWFKKNVQPELAVGATTKP